MIVSSNYDGAKYQKLEDMLSKSNNNNSMENFKSHYSDFRPVLDQISDSQRTNNLFDIYDHARFLKKDMINLVMEKALCLSEQRDVFILDNFGPDSIYPSPKVNLDVIEHSKILDRLNVPQDSLDAIMFDFNNAEYLSDIRNISTKTVNTGNIERHPDYKTVRKALSELVDTFDYSHLDFFHNLAEHFDKFFLVTLEPYMALTLGTVLFMNVIGLLHVKGSFKKIMIDLILLRKEKEAVHPGLISKILIYLFEVYNDFNNKLSFISSITEVPYFDNYFRKFLVVWFMQTVIVVSLVFYILSFFF